MERLVNELLNAVEGEARKPANPGLFRQDGDQTKLSEKRASKILYFGCQNIVFIFTRKTGSSFRICILNVTSNMC